MEVVPKCHLPTHPDCTSETLTQQRNVLETGFEYSALAVVFIFIFPFLVNVQRTFLGFWCTLTRTGTEAQCENTMD